MMIRKYFSIKLLENPLYVLRSSVTGARLKVQGKRIRQFEILIAM
jgi:hypothetical protein